MTTDPTDKSEPPFDGRLVPRGASASEQDVLRALVKRVPREQKAPEPAAAAVPERSETREVNTLCDEGRALLAEDPKAAHAKFEQAWLKDRNDLRALSHYGLTLVLVEKDRDRGLGFCEQAARRLPQDAERLINLARALVSTRNKEQAVRALKKAQELDVADPRVAEAFCSLGLRRRPPFSSLPRSFFLNRWIGRLTWWLDHRGNPQGRLMP
jgi:tetratricopeptide (TPR) repeat protein